MRATDCNGCDPDEVYHRDGCPLAGELRGRLWLRSESLPPPPKLSPPRYDDDVGDVVQTVIDEANAAMDWMQKALDRMEELSKGWDDR